MSKNNKKISRISQIAGILIFSFLLPFIWLVNVVIAFYKDIIPKKFPHFKNLIKRTKKDYSVVFNSLRPLLTFKKVFNDGRSPYLLKDLLLNKKQDILNLINKEYDNDDKIDFFVFQDRDANLKLVRHRKSNNVNLNIIKELQKNDTDYHTELSFKVKGKVKLKKLAYNYDTCFYTLKDIEKLE